MILYHGTNSDFSQINLGKTKPYKDLNNQFCFLTDRAISLLHRVK